MQRLAREIADLKGQQGRLLEQRQKDFIDQELLETRIAPLKLLCDDKERQLLDLEEQQSRKNDATDAADRIAEFCQTVACQLDHMSFEDKRATFAAFGVTVAATPDDLVITMVVDPGATTMSPSSSPMSTCTGTRPTRWTATTPTSCCTKTGRSPVN